MRGVFLDFYGTLAEAVTWGPSRAEVLARHGYLLPEEVARAWGDGAVDGLEHLEHSVSRESYEAWSVARVVGMLRDCGVDPGRAPGLAAELREAGRTFRLAAYPEAPDVLEALRARGLTVAVCSNWDWDLDRAVAQVGLADLVDLLVTSARVGARKPHPRIYRHTLDAAGGLHPGDVVFAGDTLAADVEGPLACGMRAVHVWRDPVAEPPPLPPGAHRVPDLTGLLAVVAGSRRAV